MRWGRIADGGRGGRAGRGRAEDAARRLAESRAEEDLLRHHRAELDALMPEGDEEERLGARRLLMQNAERLGEAVAEAIAEIDGEGGAQEALSRALRRLDRARDRAQGLLDSALAAAERAATETGEALAALAGAAQALELDPRALEEIEERLFALRALARKHAVAVADLPRLRAAFPTRLAGIETGAEHLAALEEAVAAARAGYLAASAALPRARERAARRLARPTAPEPQPLRPH